MRHSTTSLSKHATAAERARGNRARLAQSEAQLERDEQAVSTEDGTRAPIG